MIQLIAGMLIPGHESGGRRGEQQGDDLDLLGSVDAAQRYHRGELLLDLRAERLPPPAIVVCGRGGRDAIHGDPIMCEFLCRLPYEIHDLQLLSPHRLADHDLRFQPRTEEVRLMRRNPGASSAPPRKVGCEYAR